MTDTHRKVMIASPSLSSGGAERVMLNVAIGLRKIGYDIDFVVKCDPFDNRFEPPGDLAVHNLNAGKLLETSLKLAKRFRDTKPSVVVTALETLGLAAILARMLSRHKPAVIPTVHTVLQTRYREMPSRHTERYKALLKLLYPRANHVVAVSQAVKEEIIALAGLRESQVSVIYNPVIDENTFNMVGEPIEHPWFSSGKLVAIAVGRLVEDKNYPFMLRAISEARKKIDLHLIILGDGELKDSLEAEARRLGIEEYVDFHGFVKNPLAYMAKANIFLMTSNWEGLPTVLIEALAARVPIISTDCSSGPREILESGRWGILVPLNDLDSLVEQIVKVAQGNGIKIEPEAWERFTVDSASASYAKLIENIK